MVPEEKGDGFPGQRIVVLPRRVVHAASREPLLVDLLPTDVGFFPAARGHFRERPRGAGQAIFIYCTRGRGWTEIGGSRHAVGAEDLLVIPSGCPHRYGADAGHPWTIHWFHAMGGHTAHFVTELGLSRYRPVIHLRHDPMLLALFDELIDTLEHGYGPSQLLYASQTLAHLLGRMVWVRRQSWRGAPDPQQQIERSIAFMKQHLARRVRIRDLAVIAGLSASHYLKLFRARTGYSPMDYFIRLRMHRACQLLDTTDLSIKEIAAQVGYEDPLYFSRAFRAVNESPPSAYRRIRKG